MCHGHIDPKLLEREVQDRVQGAPIAQLDIVEGLPPELMGGLRGVWARMIANMRRAWQKIAVT